MTGIISPPFSAQSKIHIRKTVLHDSGVIVFPTDTYYALGCSALCSKAVKKIYRLKSRSTAQPLLILIDSWGMFGRYVDSVPDSRMQAMQKYWPGSLTAIFTVNQQLAKELNYQSNEVAIRMTPNPITRDLISICGVPLVGTSANQSDHPPTADVEGAIRSFSHEVDLYIDGGKTRGGMPSTIIRFSKEDKMELVRKGATKIG